MRSSIHAATGTATAKKSQRRIGFGYPVSPAAKRSTGRRTHLTFGAGVRIRIVETSNAAAGAANVVIAFRAKLRRCLLTTRR
jgi:hypothetical protein